MCSSFCCDSGALLDIYFMDILMIVLQYYSNCCFVGLTLMDPLHNQSFGQQQLSSVTNLPTCSNMMSVTGRSSDSDEMFDKTWRYYFKNKCGSTVKVDEVRNRLLESPVPCKDHVLCVCGMV